MKKPMKIGFAGIRRGTPIRTFTLTVEVQKFKVKKVTKFAGLLHAESVPPVKGLCLPTFVVWGKSELGIYAALKKAMDEMFPQRRRLKVRPLGMGVLR